MLRGIRIAACLTLALLLGSLLYVHTKLPTPKNAGVADIVDRTLRGSLALVEVHLLEGRGALTGARDLVALDPKLDSVGKTGAKTLAEASREPAERERMAELLIEHAGRNEAALLDALVVGVRTDSVRLLLVAANRASQLKQPGAKSRVATAVARQALRNSQPDALAVAVGALAAAHLVPEAHAGNKLFNAVLDRRRSDLLDAAAAVARMLPIRERRSSATRLASDDTIGWVGDAQRPTLLALSVARTPFTLNQRGVHTTDEGEKLTDFGEAHQLDPADDTIAANFADMAKTIAVEQRDATHLTEYDALLDAGLSQHPEVAAWRTARQLTIEPISLTICSCSC